MAVYALAQLTIHDRPTYERYVAAFMPVLLKYGGKLLAADLRTEVIEGEWNRDKVILIEFADEQSFRTWADSPEYVGIARDRVAATEGPVLLVHGLGS